MQLSSHLLVGARAVPGANGAIRATNPATGETLEPAFGGATLDDLDQACALAEQAFDPYRERPPQARAAFLESIAEQLLALGDELVERCVLETGLPRGRIEGERGRTVNQLRLFAAVVRSGDHLDLRIDPAQPGRAPLPRPDLRLRHIPVGPVAVFGASNFPLAFSVAGGDTASALAAGCPVLAKAHSAHPGTSALAGLAIQRAVRDCGMPEGTFSLLFDSGRAVGQALVSDRRIKAVGFTGSRAGGAALMALAAARAEPIPVYAEMSSINPVLLFPHALAARAEEIGKAFAASLTLGVGQFCTNPGLVLALDSADLDTFIDSASTALRAAAAGTMLTAGIAASYRSGVDALAGHAAVATLAQNVHAEGKGAAALFRTTGVAFLADHALHGEVFGPAALLVVCRDMAEMRAVTEVLEGQLTATLQIDADDYAAAMALLPALERKVGRILVNGFPTGVEVSTAMVHGGPFPATSDGRSTSVGTGAISRFLRPVCYQNMPQALLPAVLRDDAMAGSWRRMDGTLAKA